MTLWVEILVEVLYKSYFLFWLKMAQSQNSRVQHCKIFITHTKKEENYLFYTFNQTYVIYFITI